MRSEWPRDRGRNSFASNFEWRAAMAGSVNKVILVGNLGKDPEIRRTQDGRPIANLSIATSETWRDKATGERKEKTEWHRVVIFNEGLCKVAEQYLKKGAKVYIEGQLQTRKWTDQSGVEKYSTEVVLQGFNSTLTMLDGRSGGGGGSFGSDDPAAISARRPGRRRAAPRGCRRAVAATATWTTTFRSELAVRELPSLIQALTFESRLTKVGGSSKLAVFGLSRNRVRWPD